MDDGDRRSARMVVQRPPCAGNSARGVFPQLQSPFLRHLARRQVSFLYGSLRVEDEHLRAAGGLRLGAANHLRDRPRHRRILLGQQRPAALPEGHRRRRELPALRRQSGRQRSEGLHGDSRRADADHRSARGDRLADYRQHESAQSADIRSVPAQPQHGRDDAAGREPRQHSGLDDRPRRQAAGRLCDRRRRQHADSVSGNGAGAVSSGADHLFQGRGELLRVHARQ